MITRKVFASLAAASMVFGSSAASAAPVQVADVRTGSPVGDSEQIAPIIPILLLVIVIGIIAAISANNTLDPRSP